MPAHLCSQSSASNPQPIWRTARGFGERVGRGQKPADIAASMLAVAEGYPTTRSAYQLARRYGVTTPVIDEVYATLYEGKNVAQTVRDLMSRDPKPE